MKPSSSRISFFVLSLVVIVLTTVLSGFVFMNYGGNNGCFAWTDRLLAPLRGYESCGQLGMMLGFLGGIIAVFLLFLIFRKKRNV